MIEQQNLLHVKLITERLLLRPIEDEDAVTLNIFLADPEIAAAMLTIPYPCPLENTERWIRLQRNACAEGDEINFAIVIRATNEVVGIIGLELNKTHDRAEFGYWLGKKYWNRGYCTEAGKAVLRYGFEELGLHRIYSEYMMDNVASGKVLEKVGMFFEGSQKQHLYKSGVFKDLGHYGIVADDYGYHANQDS
jgi:[ribosomal protein S5]-alanine N-acetyltransferase